MLTDWEYEHLRTIRRVPAQKRSITLERIAAESKLLEWASPNQQVRLYGYFYPVKKARKKREFKMEAHKRARNARRQAHGDRIPVGPTLVRQPGILERIAEEQRAGQRERGIGLGILPGNAQAIPGREVTWDDAAADTARLIDRLEGRV